MNLPKKYLVPLLVLPVAMVGVYLGYVLWTHRSYTTKHFSTTGAEYDCSQPVRVRDAKAPFKSNAPTTVQVPVSQSDVDRYCQVVNAY